MTIKQDSATSSSITLTWYSGFHGGADQTFHILYKRSEAAQWKDGATVPDDKQTYIQFNTTVSRLDEDTSYTLFITTVNEFGSRNSDMVTGRTAVVPGMTNYFSIIYLDCGQKSWSVVSR